MSRRKSKYPRVLLTDGLTRLVQTGRDGFTWERYGFDALRDVRWNEFTPEAIGMRSEPVLLRALSRCADRARRRRRRS